MNEQPIKTICASKINWSRGNGVCRATDLFGSYRTPNVIKVESPVTGKIKKFSLDEMEAFDAEYWDGEFTILRSDDKKHSITIWNH